MSVYDSLTSSINYVDGFLQDTTVGHCVKILNDTGCSLFFITSAITSMITGNKNRTSALENEKLDINFQEELQKQKEQFDDDKESKENDFKKRLKLIQRQNSRLQNARKLEFDKKSNQLEMFFNGWPLACSVAGLLHHIHATPIFDSPFNIVIARVQSDFKNDQLAKNYRDPEEMGKGISDIVIDTLLEMGINKDCIHLVNDKCQIYGGCLFANVYAVMHSLPTIVISPVVYDGKIHITIGLWNQDSSFPYQEEVMAFDYNGEKAYSDIKYKEDKVSELIQSLVAVATVFNETFLLSEGRPVNNKYPQYLKRENINKSYPYIVDFALKEYMSLLIDPQQDLIDESDPIDMPHSVLGNKYYTELKSRIMSHIEPLNS